MRKAKIHQIRIDFHVTPEIKRYVYVYLIEANNCYLVDSGIYGCEKQILQYLEGIGRTASDIKGIVLTHAHPDHIGSAAWFQEHTDCRIYASAGEKRWIENIDLQFQERPIPNFYALAGRSSRVDVVVQNGDIIELEDGLYLEVIRTAGHSIEGLSYRLGKDMFIGEAIPVQGDIPIMINESEMRKTLQRFKQITGVNTFYPAWDMIYSEEMMRRKLQEANELLDSLKQAVVSQDEGDALPVLVDKVCQALNQNMLKSNPLFATTVNCLREGRV